VASVLLVGIFLFRLPACHWCLSILAFLSAVAAYSFVSSLPLLPACGLSAVAACLHLGPHVLPRYLSAGHWKFGMLLLMFFAQKCTKNTHKPALVLKSME
jgi:hypothetical protein